VGKIYPHKDFQGIMVLLEVLALLYWKAFVGTKRFPLGGIFGPPTDVKAKEGGLLF